ncbi:MAG TPA: radical SAM protein [Methanomassiliicoccales archaeon]|nr:radical SAM protein [Methanomassiliicoccales archaeon]
MSSTKEAYAFGPVQSRRFGSSLGLNTVPMKTCDYSCVYCQLGPTIHRTIERACYYRPQKVVEALRECLDRARSEPDYVTFIGEGEPTLAANLGEIVAKSREVWKGKKALVTNGSLLHLPEVRESVKDFDVVSPTVSGADAFVFKRIHRPHPRISFDLVIQGLLELGDVYDGSIWPEVMLVKDYNDSDRSIEGIGEILKKMAPDKVFVSVPTRPPARKGVEPAGERAIERAMQTFPRAVDMTRPESVEFAQSSEESVQHLLSIARFHPLREDQAIAILKMGEEAEARELLADLVSSGRIRAREFQGVRYYMSGPEPR